jgi:hypothetical protein
MPNINEYQLMKWGSDISGDNYNKFSVYWRPSLAEEWRKLPVYEPHGFEYIPRLDSYVVFGHEEIHHYKAGRKDAIHRIYIR